MESIVILVAVLIVLWIFRKSINEWTATAEDKSKVASAKVSMQNRKDEVEIVTEAEELLASGYKGLSKDMEAFIRHGRPLPTEQEAS